MEDFIVTIVIPFYNAKDFVTQAVESALAQPETGEVLLINDNSPDGGVEVCQSLVNKYPKVKLLMHPDGGNHGPGASRNLGIHNAQYPYIAFLDADDYFLQDRFRITKKIFFDNENIDGVYEALGAIYENESSKQLFSTLSIKELTTVQEIIAPEMLFKKLIGGKVGYFSFDSFTARKELFTKVAFFNENLMTSQDRDLMLKLSSKGRLFPGEIKNPVAIRRVHDNNRITKLLTDRESAYYSSIMMWESMYKWGKINLPNQYQKEVIANFIKCYKKADYLPKSNLKNYYFTRKKMAELAKEYPSIFFTINFWKSLFPAIGFIRKLFL